MYVAAQLVGTDQLYEEAPYRNFLIEQFAGTSETLLYIRPPFYAALLSPLGLLPYEWSHVVWWLLRAAALVGFVMLWRIPSRMTVIGMTLACMPILGSLVNGQDGLFVLFLLALVWHRIERGKPFQAGLALSLCAIKYHLFLMLPIWLLSRSGRPLLRGFCLGASLLIGISFWVGGWNWPVEYLHLIQSSNISPIVPQMPNLHGLFSGIIGAPYLEVVGTVAVGWACWRASEQANRLYGFSAVIVGGLLTSYHSYFTDCMILLPAVLVLRDIDARPWLKKLSLVLLVPAPLLIAGPSSVLVQALLVVVLFTMALAPSDVDGSAFADRGEGIGVTA